MSDTVEFLTLTFTIALRSNPLKLLLKLAIRLKHNMLLSPSLCWVFLSTQYKFKPDSEVIHLMKHYARCCANKTPTQKTLELARERAIKNPKSDRKGDCCLSVEGIRRLLEAEIMMWHQQINWWYEPIIEIHTIVNMGVYQHYI